MTVRIDWGKIKNIMGSLDMGEPYIFIIPHGGRHLLQSLTERLQWEATFRTDDYDYSDWDDLQALVADTQAGLMGETKLSDLLDALNDILTAINNIKLVSQNQIQCCDQLGTPTPNPGIIIDQGDPPPFYGDDPITTWEEYKQRVCAASLLWVESMITAFDELSRLVDSGLLFVTGIAAVFAVFALPAVGFLLAIPYVSAVGIFSVLVELLVGDHLDELSAHFADHKAEIANLIYCANSPDTAYVDLFAYFDANYNDTQVLLLSWFNILNSLNIIYAGEDADGNKVDVEPDASCTCVALPVLSGIKFATGTSTLDLITDEFGNVISPTDEIFYNKEYRITARKAATWEFIQLNFQWLTSGHTEIGFEWLAKSGPDGWFAFPNAGVNGGYKLRATKADLSTYGELHNSQQPTPGGKWEGKQHTVYGRDTASGHPIFHFRFFEAIL